MRIDARKPVGRGKARAGPGEAHSVEERQQTYHVRQPIGWTSARDGAQTVDYWFDLRACYYAAIGGARTQKRRRRLALSACLHAFQRSRSTRAALHAPTPAPIIPECVGDRKRSARQLQL